MITATQTRWGIRGFLGIAISAIGFAMFSASQSTVRRTTASVVDASSTELIRALERLERSWHPRDRERALAAMEPRVPHYVPGLKRMLGPATHPLSASAIDLVARFRIVALEARLEQLAEEGPVELRAAAVRAVDVLDPWPAEALLEFLRGDRVDVRVAAIQILSRRSDAPWERVLEQLAGLPEGARADALASMPEELPPAAIEALLRVCLGDPSTAIEFVELLGRSRIDARTEPLLASCLGSVDAGIVHAALEALGTKAAPLAEIDPVWDLVTDPSRDDELRVTAMRCLWRTGLEDVERLRQMAFTMPPRARYYAARCLIDAGATREGVETLIDLLESPADVTGADGALRLPGEAGSSESAAVASRQALARLARMTPNATESEFREWLWQLPSDWVPQAALAAPPF